MDQKHLVPGDTGLIENIVSYLKAKGIFDEFRHECLADVDTKSSCQNLSQRVDGYTTKFLLTETFHADLNKNELRNKLRRHIDESGMLAVGADHVVEQVINPKIGHFFLPKVAEVVHQYIKEETEKFHKKQESNEVINFEKYNCDSSSNKAKVVIDPIADILSFSYSKPKQTTQNIPSKVADTVKQERKKELPDSTKTLDSAIKLEKKKEETSQQPKIAELATKNKKEETAAIQTKSLDVASNVEKKKDENVLIKVEDVEIADENLPSAPELAMKDVKEPIKIKKEVKSEEPDAASELLKKALKETLKVEKKKADDVNTTSSEVVSQSGENIPIKAAAAPPKSSSVNKIKSDPDKSKKVKSHDGQKSSISTGEIRKHKTKESDAKSLEDKHTKSKIIKSATKDSSSPFKSGTPSKQGKSDKVEEGSVKIKSKESHSKSSDSSSQKSTSSKSSSTKKEHSSLKVKISSDKHEKSKSSKSADFKSNIKAQTESSSSSDKGNKSSLQYSSSYESSQGSDMDRSSSSSVHSKEKQKHFSKHQKKESSGSDKSTKETSDKSGSQSSSSSETFKKHKLMKHGIEKHKKSHAIQESAKISSRSNSFGSTSSTSDSPSSAKETAASNSEETSDNSSKPSDKKKKSSKDKEQCGSPQDFPPPPPPPPPSLGFPTQGTSSSAELSSMDETQSSQESEVSSEDSDEELDAESEFDVENLYSSSTLGTSTTKLKTPEILNDIYDIFLYSSSSSDFEGYGSSPERNLVRHPSDVSVSPVDTSDLSSFDDELSGSDVETGEGAPKKLTIKEAEDILRAKTKPQTSEELQNTSSIENTVDQEKPPNSNLQLLVPMEIEAESEISTPPEPKRESRRERKLNPKYASSEYASIFNSKRTSFITKQTNQSEDKETNAVSPTVVSTARKSELPSQEKKNSQTPTRRSSFTNTDKSQPCAAELRKSLNFNPVEVLSDSTISPSNEFIEFDSAESSPSLEEKPSLNTNEKSYIISASDSYNRIALKIKMSGSKNDNEANKDLISHGVKRKFSDAGKSPAKKVCRRNSENSCTTDSVANENKPFNPKEVNASLVLSVEQKSNKDNFHKQKMNNNGDVLNKIEHARKNSHSKPNHVNEQPMEE